MPDDYLDGNDSFWCKFFAVFNSCNFLTANTLAFTLVRMQLICQSMCMCCREAARVSLAGETAT